MAAFRGRPRGPPAPAGARRGSAPREGGHERRFAEIVGHAGRMGEQLAQRGTRRASSARPPSRMGCRGVETIALYAAMCSRGRYERASQLLPRAVPITAVRARSTASPTRSGPPNARSPRSSHRGIVVFGALVRGMSNSRRRLARLCASWMARSSAMTLARSLARSRLAPPRSGGRGWRVRDKRGGADMGRVWTLACCRG